RPKTRCTRGVVFIVHGSAFYLWRTVKKLMAPSNKLSKNHRRKVGITTRLEADHDAILKLLTRD
ncbi:MAG TPA: hypothetical protein DCG89_05135, partial [Spartobacteria bacterium]|nr:hypothetical protein [Spartobacteria bacterium]